MAKTLEFRGIGKSYPGVRALDSVNFKVESGKVPLTGEPFVYKMTGVTLPKNDAHALSLFFDFGGAPVGTEIKISKIYFEESVDMSYDDANNLWKAVDEGSAFISVTPWFADNSWSQIGDPQWSHKGKVWELTIPEGMGGSQWQGQFPINTTLSTAMPTTSRVR